MIEPKYAPNFFNSSFGCVGIQVMFRCQQLVDILEKYGIERIYSNEFGNVEEWIVISDELKLTLPTNKEDFKCWILAWFETYADYPLDLANCENFESISDNSRIALRTELEASIDDIVNEMEYAYIQVLELFIDSGDWEGSTVEYKNNKIKSSEIVKTKDVESLAELFDVTDIICCNEY
jgi:hypothetical protein